MITLYETAFYCPHITVAGTRQFGKGTGNAHPAKKEKMEAEVLARVRAIIIALMHQKVVAITCTQVAKNKKTENLILNRVSAIPEVKAYMRKYNGKRPAIILSDYPDADTKFYTVKMGLNNNPDIFVYDSTFFVDSKTFQVYYWDALNDNGEGITLQLWRRWRNTSGFHKMHIYKAGKLVVLAEQ